MMKSNYKRYYDALTGKSFSPYVPKYNSALSNSDAKISTVESTIGSSMWVEKGIEIIKIN